MHSSHTDIICTAFTCFILFNANRNIFVVAFFILFILRHDSFLQIHEWNLMMKTIMKKQSSNNNTHNAWQEPIHTTRMPEGWNSVWAMRKNIEYLYGWVPVPDASQSAAEKKSFNLIVWSALFLMLWKLWMHPQGSCPYVHCPVVALHSQWQWKKKCYSTLPHPHRMASTFNSKSVHI